jgi:uncharacterized protein YbjQ (UPF0145 family)
MTPMMVVTSFHIEGKRVVKTLGLACGAATRATGLRHNFVAWIKSNFGGELEEHTKTLAEAREQALDRLREHARSMGANAVVSVRFATVEISSHAAEILAYGTAIVVEDAAPSTVPRG